jgi:mono/diheme cytochrome c family protein
VRRIIFSRSPLIAALVTSALLIITASEAMSGGTQVNSTNQNSFYGEIKKAPERASAKQNPLSNDPDAPRAGKKLYEQHCAECHESSSGGRNKAPTLFVNQVQQASPGALFWVITNGVVRRGMPVWSKLPEAQRWQIVTYLNSTSIIGSQ